ncbi:fimbrial protein [Cedecea colo]|uniref:Fimbrial protein n=1 Tax=Cedecea colo TaxID=2552946 RepID=A0ABX0VLA0_9ENTR|nr:fimbrial protein [Cedecea colo]NIY47839.1 hypothetical protein [Cedecea colo]
MKNYIFTASVLFMSVFYTATVHAAGCAALASGSGVEGNKLDYQLRSPIVAIDLDAPIGSILWTRNINTAGMKWICQSTAQRQYRSTIGPAFSKITGSNLRGNIYATGIEGLGIQITDLYQPNKAVPNIAYPTAQQTFTWSNTGYTRIDFIKVGPIGAGNLNNGLLATYSFDGVTVMTVSILGSRLKHKSCTIDGQHNRTIPLGTFKTTDIVNKSKDVPFELKLKCQADAVPVYVQFDALNGSSGDGLLNLDTTVEDPASGVAVEIIDVSDNMPLKLGREIKYHMNQETLVSIPLIAHYKKTGAVITGGKANAGMTVTINER